MTCPKESIEKLIWWVAKRYTLEFSTA